MTKRNLFKSQNRHREIIAMKKKKDKNLGQFYLMFFHFFRVEKKEKENFKKIVKEKPFEREEKLMRDMREIR